MKKKAQGEIFGIALMFVVIIIGLIVYSQISALNNIDDESKVEGKYRILAEGTLNSILKMSTTCEVGRNRNSVKDLINYCLANEYGSRDAVLQCGDGSKKSCEESIRLLNTTLYKMFNSTDNSGLAMVPFELTMTIPENEDSNLYNITLTNFGDYQYRGNLITKENRRKYYFKKASSGLKPWATAQRDIEVELNIYFRD